MYNPNKKTSLETHFALAVFNTAVNSGCLRNHLTFIKTYKEITGREVPAVTDGSIKRYEVSSASLNDKIIVDVWVPEGYDGTDTSVTYPVIYAHDGQNLFDPKLSYANVAWEIDATATRLISDGSIIAPIIVGISNRGAKGLRANDYFPEKAIQYIPESERDKTLIYDTCKDVFFRRPGSGVCHPGAKTAD